MKKEKQELILIRHKRKLKKDKKELKALSKNQEKSNKLTNKGKRKQKLFPFLIKSEKVKTSSDTISYKRMLKDGICQIDKKKFSKTIRFFDINYRLMAEEDQESIFNEFSSFLNFFDTNVDVQLTYISKVGENEEIKDLINIKDSDDEFNDIRAEYREMLINQSTKGSNSLSKSMYITFSVIADDLKNARIRLDRLELDILNNFKQMGVKAYSLDGVERLKLLHSMLNKDEKFVFSYDDLKYSGLMTKDYIAPNSFTFNKQDYFKTGSQFGEVNFLQILAPEMSDKMLSEFLEVEENIVINFHIKAIEQMEAIKNIKRKLTDLDKMKIEENKKAIRSGYDMDIMPSDLLTYGIEAKQLLSELQTHNEKMFLITILFTVIDDKKSSLDNTVLQLKSIANRHNCSLKNLNYQQEQGLISTLPLSKNEIEIERGLTTSATAVFIPFTTETPGSGKSFSAKREITNAFLITNDDIIVADPEGEYSEIVQALNGEVVKISPTSKDYINPMDINLDYADEDNPLSLKSDFILSLFELVVGNNKLSAEEISVIDRCLPKLYQDYFNNPIPENMPILEDLYKMLKSQEEKVGKKLATEMEIYVFGSLNVFNHRTNVDTAKRVVCYDIKELGKQLKKIGMLVVQDQVWNRVSTNRMNKKATRYYIDEMHLLLKEPQTASYSVEIWKRFRKWGGMPTGLTQNVKDLLQSQEIENIFDNTDFILMLNQAGTDREILAKKLNISNHQLSYVTNSSAGEGLIFYGNTIVPFIDRFPQNTKLYSLMTTRLEETENR